LKDLESNHFLDKKAWTTKEGELISNTELLKDQIDYSLNMGFQLALDQVHVLHSEVDLSQADISKSVVDGQLVDVDIIRNFRLYMS